MRKIKVVYRKMGCCTWIRDLTVESWTILTPATRDHCTWIGDESGMIEWQRGQTMEMDMSVSNFFYLSYQ